MARKTSQSGTTAKPKHAGGRPRKWTDLEGFQAAIDEYFEDEPDCPTVCGLARHLDFADRHSLADYVARGDEFSLPVKRAMNRVEESHERALYEGRCTGSIFWLKNHKWQDTQDHNLNAGPETLAALFAGRVAK